MTDEKFTFIEDVREKKRTATGARHKRTHCGKGGAIRFPSDFKSKKELRAMNGEVKTYKLNDPAGWKEFKVWPDDIKRDYITALRKKFNVNDSKIADMFGVTRGAMCREMKRLGISGGTKSREALDKDGWYAWVNGVPVEGKDGDTVFTRGKCFEFEVDEPSGEAVPEVAETCDEGVLEQAEKCDAADSPAASDFVFRFDDKGFTVAKEVKPAIPGWGQMELEGTVEECAKTLEMLLADKRVKLAVSWTVVE